jgi:hypothetical protein
MVHLRPARQRPTGSCCLQGEQIKTSAPPVKKVVDELYTLHHLDNSKNGNYSCSLGAPLYYTSSCPEGSFDKPRSITTRSIYSRSKHLSAATMLVTAAQTASVDDYRDSQPTSTSYDIEQGDDFVGWISYDGNYCTFMSQYIPSCHNIFPPVVDLFSRPRSLDAAD